MFTGSSSQVKSTVQLLMYGMESSVHWQFKSSEGLCSSKHWEVYGKGLHSVFKCSKAECIQQSVGKGLYTSVQWGYVFKSNEQRVY